MLDKEQRLADKQALIDHFETLYREHGNSFATLGFGSDGSQRRRFEVMCEVGDLTGSSILDVCCGMADLADYLAQQDPTATYSGVEIIPAFVEDIHQRRLELDVELFDIALDETDQRWDFVFANGIFFLEVSDSEELVRTCVANMFRLCKKAVAFTSLSRYADKKDKGEFLASPEETFAFCKTLTPYVTLRHDYMPHDFTVYLYRDQQTG